MSNSLILNCRGGQARTDDPLVPNQIRYQLRYTPHCAPKPWRRSILTSEALTKEVISPGPMIQPTKEAQKYHKFSDFITYSQLF